MLHTSSVVAHIEGAHMLNMHPRVNICLSDCSPWDDDSDGDDDEDDDENEDVRSDRVSICLSDHACISSTRGSSQHVAHEQLCTQSSRSWTAWGNLERPFRAVRTKGEDVLSFYLSFLRFVSSFLWLVANDVGDVTFTDVADSFFIFCSRECELRRNWMWKFNKVFF